MTILELRQRFRTDLAPLYGQNEIDDIFKRATAFLFGWSSLKVGLAPNDILTDEEQKSALNILAQLKAAVPLQYVLGVSHFRHLSLNVDPSVLIPRPETEELVQWVLDDHSEDECHVMDLCTGSGAIALALKQERPNWTVSALEVSAPALEVAKGNATKNDLDIAWQHADLLKDTIDFSTVDIVVSNPPYVLPSEKKQMHANVLAHEPPLALFVPEEDPLLFYRTIIEQVKRSSSKNIPIYFEINPLAVEAMNVLNVQHGGKASQMKKDLFGKKRFLKFEQ